MIKYTAFGVATFLGAFLLFQVQPLIGKFILPWFGGATSVWTACMLFFQVMLLAGYAYAHALTRIKSGFLQAAIHMLLLSTALLFLPPVPSEHWKRVTAADPTWHILGLLAATLGLPYLLLSATSPLVQAWFYRASPGSSPYRLYALSNIGSLAALITFPLVFEPLFTRQTLSAMWSWVFVAFGVSLAFCGGYVRQKPGTIESSGEQGATRQGDPWIWVLLPCAGSIMLLATTNKICQDIAVVPFLWILPLAVYLVSFIIAFENARWYRRAIYLPALALFSAAVCVVLFKAPHPPLLLQIAAYCALLFVYCMVCHGEVYRLKPHPTRLTAFYLCIAAGGALGGIFVGLIAPMIFDNYLEFHFGMVLGPVVLAFILRRDALPNLAISVGIAALVLAVFLAEHITRLNKDVVARARNFYGVLRVTDNNPNIPQAHIKRMMSGDIWHGEQFVEPEFAMRPTTYYVEPSGVSRALRSIPPGNRKIGVVGLGVGTLAAYAHAGDTFRFYEINPASKRFAERQFTFLLRATGQVEVVLGDARLSLQGEPPQGYDLLVLDAFSGDSIPVHLLTREAFVVYLQHLKPGGTMAVHITNRHLDLAPVVQKLAQHHEMKLAYIPYTIGDVAWHYGSFWMLLSRDARFLENELIRSGAVTLERKNVRLWTDDYASLLPLLKYESR